MSMSNTLQSFMFQFLLHREGEMNVLEDSTRKLFCLEGKVVKSLPLCFEVNIQFNWPCEYEVH